MPSTITISVGETRTLTATLTDGGTTVSGIVDFNIDNNGGVLGLLVSGGNTAKVTGYAPGTATVTASLLNNPAVKDTVTVTVAAPGPVTVALTVTG
jgi:hypothetical protein